MRPTSIIIAGALAALALAPAAQAAELLVDGGFEHAFEVSNPNDRWDVVAGDDAHNANSRGHTIESGQTPPTNFHVQFLPSADDPQGFNYLPVEGDKFGIIGGQLGSIFGGATTIRQSFHVYGTSQFSGYAAFAGYDGQAFNDSAYVRLFTGAGQLVSQLFHADLASLGDNGFTSWTPLSYTIAGAGDYYLEASSFNSDDMVSSYLLLDGFSVQGPVPEPGAWAMMILGFFGLGALMRRRRAATA